MCSGRVNPTFILKAFALGADGVLIAGCHPGDCHYIEQNYKTIRRHAMLRYFLEQMGIEHDRLRLVWASAAEGQFLAESIDRFVADVKQLGPLNWPAELGGEWRRRHEALEDIVARTRGSDGGPGMNGDAKGKLALYWAASCGGCEIAVLAINEKILDVAALFDIVFWPVAVDAKVRDVENMPDGSIDVCLFNGGIRTSEQEYMARLLRRKSKVLVAFGSCASEGCIPGLANATNRRSRSSTPLPPDALDREPRAGSSRSPKTEVPEGTLHLPVFYDTLRTLTRPCRWTTTCPAARPRPSGSGTRSWRSSSGTCRRRVGDRRRDHRVRGVPADEERKEGQEVLPHLAGHPGRRDVPAGAGHLVLRDRDAGRAAGPLPAGQLALHRLLRAERRRPRLTAPG